MKLLWRLSKEALQYRLYYVAAVLATFALTAVNLAAPRILSAMTGYVSEGVTQESLDKIVVFTVALVGLYLLRILFRFMSNYFAHSAAWNLVEKLRLKVYDHIQAFSMRFFSDKQTGDLMSRVVNDTATFELLYAHIIPEMITNGVTLIGVFVMLLLINAKLALLTCIPIPFILFAGWYFSKKIRPNFRAAQKELAGLNAKLQDNFSGIQEIQAFGQETFEHKNVSGHANAFTTSMLDALKKSAFFNPGVEFLSSTGTIIVVGVGGLLAFRGELNVSDIVAFLLYLSMFYAPITGFGRLMEEIQQATAGAERVIAVLDTPSEIVDEPGAKDIGKPRGAISFENVDFSYEQGIPVLKNVSFSCEPGQMIALVGPTGVGKTTLTQLIARFYDPDSGVVRIDGHDVKHATLDSLRKSISPVLQDTFLFNGTVAENIGYADPAATMDEIIEASKAAHIHEDVELMPDKYETRVGERGMRLSGGQKQRIAIARAILRKAPIIILDEATASVDTQTERKIQQAISELAGTRTIVAIAHRLSTIQNADLILVMEDGGIVQRGTHEQLLREEGLYKSLQAAFANP